LVETSLPIGKKENEMPSQQNQNQNKSTGFSQKNDKVGNIRNDKLNKQGQNQSGSEDDKA
jgi:hypothetical protein